MNDAISDKALDQEFCRLNEDYEKANRSVVPFQRTDTPVKKSRYHLGKSLTDDSLRKMSLFVSPHIKNED
ncbi:MAG: hypothetical protein UT65_C0011G0012 [Parcubacteria group bacterium GW2011_GWF2_39_8b]|nr:MAG: hypothetical protein UT65_C0011G0012 [Parcubacteria group bacterium GW2011_GWF2_39_8b]KKR45597.1 MAG: hypothetical protein UT81_C0010G0020 [Parcubacteria group bacterium GW2011_GWA2_40_14]OHA93883.1 MAG: hypothetical protein A2W58_00370 [Candidatus Zambryskibacteria bacterium RIFCSPHIGHO2_02_38_10.5]OHA97304.1 MAG: hypothetical protein A3C63_01125 [Candidatus Zambryskibacteria bacterium RIFCSPHIGHO2_02_FULL_39_82]OHB07489.1 MAG: hypothetical protein A2W64_03860 [Candidatus Zambryskibact